MDQDPIGAVWLYVKSTTPAFSIKIVILLQTTKLSANFIFDKLLIANSLSPRLIYYNRFCRLEFSETLLEALTMIQSKWSISIKIINCIQTTKYFTRNVVLGPLGFCWLLITVFAKIFLRIFLFYCKLFAKFM